MYSIIVFDLPNILQLGVAQSGRDVDKAEECATAGFPWALGAISHTCGTDIAVLPGCAAYYRVRVSDNMPSFGAGDHEAVIVELVEVLVENEEVDANGDGTTGADCQLPMSTAYLREIGLVTAVGRAVVP